MESDGKSTTKKGHKLLMGLPKLKLKKKPVKSSLEALCPVLRQLIGYLHEKVIHVEGVFRLSGSLTAMQQLQKSVLKGEEVDLKDIEDIHVVTGLFKSLLREMQEPLIPFSAYTPLLDRSESMSAPDIRVKVYRTVLSNIPPLNQEILDEVIRLAIDVASHERETRMTTRNLAVVLGPVLMRRSPKEETLETLMADSAKVVDTVKEIMDKWSEITPRPEAKKPIPTIWSPSATTPRAPSDEPSSPRVAEESIDYKLKWQAAAKRSEELERDYTVTFLHATNLQTKLQERDETILFLQEQLKQLEEQQQASARDELDEASKLAAQLRDESRKWQDAVASLETDIDSMKRSQTELSRELQTERGLHRLTKDRLAALDAEKAKNEDSQASKLRGLELQVADKEAAMRSIRDTLKEREATISDLKLRVNRMEAEAKESEKQNSDLKRVVADLERDKAASAALFSSLKNEKNTIERDWLQLKSRVAALESQISDKQDDAQQRLEQHRASAAENAELRFHLFNWIVLSIKLDLLARGVSAVNIDKNELFQKLEDEKVAISKWPSVVLLALDN